MEAKVIAKCSIRIEYDISNVIKSLKEEYLQYFVTCALSCIKSELSDAT